MLKRRCYVSKESIVLGETYIGKIPPGSQRLGKMHEYLAASGIVSRWIVLLYGMGMAARVQDRCRIRTTSVAASTRTGHIEPLALNKKITTIFLLWVTCSIDCFSGLFLA